MLFSVICCSLVFLLFSSLERKFWLFSMHSEMFYEVNDHCSRVFRRKWPMSKIDVKSMEFAGFKSVYSISSDGWNVFSLYYGWYCEVHDIICSRFFEVHNLCLEKNSFPKYVIFTRFTVTAVHGGVSYATTSSALWDVV